MAKVCESIFPMGSFYKQKSDGFYIDDDLKSNIDIMVRTIGKDMQFLGLVTGKGGVRVGKSTIAQQCGTYFTFEVNKHYKTNNTFDISNIFFKAEELIEKAPTFPKFSVIVLDEGDDLTLHYWKDLAQRLRKFFRKCGQLNLFIIMILPDFFELPKHYAVSRSNFLINVKFQGEFERGFFEFYSARKKRELYFKGKRYSDYDCVKPDFEGGFVDLYTIDKEKYKEKKYKDLIEEEELKSDPEFIKKETLKHYFKKVVAYFKQHHTMSELSKAFGIGETQAYELLADKEILFKEKNNDN